jgi:PBP1b-binding outer membrane lipoprotein LpoB
MKKLKIISLFVAILFMASCANTAKFPVSSVAPSADIKATKKNDKNGNIRIKITARNLAAADRLTPPQKVYVAWIVTDTGGVRNLGQMTHKNANKVTIETLTPQEFTEVFITAEQDGNISYPEGVEISRARFKK